MVQARRILLGTAILALSLDLSIRAEEEGPDNALLATLGQRLFFEEGFSSSKGDLETSCGSCHMPADPLGNRAFTELLALSWHPFRTEHPVRETLRNTPTLMDLAGQHFVHFDGEFDSLEQQSRETFVGRNFGWLPEERDEATAQFVALLRNPDEPYVQEFHDVLQLSPADASATELLDGAAQAVATFVRSLTSDFTSPYDRFITANEIPNGPEEHESPDAYADRVMTLLFAKTTLNGLEFVKGFEAKELEGYRTFLRTEGSDRAGNCVACHVPPTFTDGSFHNVGVAQDAYNAMHGFGSFAKLDIPERPARENRQFLQSASTETPGVVDLGYWNFAKSEDSPLHRADDTAETFFARTIATFKTPTLRHLAATDPYMHNGAYKSIESAIDLKIRSAFEARMGQLRNPDPELTKIRMVHENIPALFAFLNALHDKGERKAREQPRPDPPAFYVAPSVRDENGYEPISADDGPVN